MCGSIENWWCDTDASRIVDGWIVIESWDQWRSTALLIFHTDQGRCVQCGVEETKRGSNARQCPCVPYAFLSVPGHCALTDPGRRNMTLCIDSNPRSSWGMWNCLCCLSNKCSVCFDLVFQDSVDSDDRCFSRWIVAHWHSSTAMESVSWQTIFFKFSNHQLIRPLSWKHFQ